MHLRKTSKAACGRKLQLWLNSSLASRLPLHSNFCFFKAWTRPVRHSAVPHLSSLWSHEFRRHARELKEGKRSGDTEDKRWSLLLPFSLSLSLFHYLSCLMLVHFDDQISEWDPRKHSFVPRVVKPASARRTIIGLSLSPNCGRRKGEGRRKRKTVKTDRSRYWFLYHALWFVNLKDNDQPIESGRRYWKGRNSETWTVNLYQYCTNEHPRTVKSN